MEIFEEEKTFWKHLEKVVNITKDLETCGYILKPLENTAKFFWRTVRNKLEKSVGHI